MMHKLQKQILNLAKRGALKGVSLRGIGRLAGEPHAQNIKHHLAQLKKRGLVRVKEEEQGITVEPVKKSSFFDGFKAIPVLGSASCGDAVNFADECVEEYIQVSKGILRNKKVNFAIKAEGNSLNEADVCGKAIEDGDYVLIDSSVKDPKDGDYVLSVIDEVANIKKFYRDKKNNQVVLISESTEDLPPIYVGADYDSKYLVNGRVVDVLKYPKLK